MNDIFSAGYNLSKQANEDSLNSSCALNTNKDARQHLIAKRAKGILQSKEVVQTLLHKILRERILKPNYSRLVVLLKDCQTIQVIVRLNL